MTLRSQFGPDWTREAARQVNPVLSRFGLISSAALAGNAGKAIVVNAAADGLAFATVGGGTGGGYTVVTKIAGYTETATTGELVIKADLAAGFTIVLPTAVGNTAKITVKKMQAAGSIIVDGNAAETIDGALTATLTAQYQSTTLVSDNANWLII